MNFLLIFSLVLFMPKIVFADIISISPLEELLFFMYFPAFFGGIVLAITAFLTVVAIIAKVILKISNNSDSLNAAMSFENKLYPVLFWLSNFLAFYIIIDEMHEFNPLMGLFIIVFAIAVILRLGKKEKSSAIVFGIGTIILAIVIIASMVIDATGDSHNQRLEKYVYGDEIFNEVLYLQEIKEINEGFFKIKVTYKNRTYITPEEIEELQHIVIDDAETRYKVKSTMKGNKIRAVEITSSF